MGAGVVGSSTALALKRRGYNVKLLEQFFVGHTRGSSHGPSRIIRNLYEPDLCNLSMILVCGAEASERKQKYKATGNRLKKRIYIFFCTHRHRRASFRSRLSIAFIFFVKCFFHQDDSNDLYYFEIGIHTKNVI